MAISLKRWLATKAMNAFRTEYNENLDALETAINGLQANSSLLEKTVTFTSGYAMISAADLGVTNVAAHKWIAQATMNSSVPVCVYIRLYIGGMALYLYTHTGSQAPDGDYKIFIRKD
jgi:hypothetical protein